MKTRPACRIALAATLLCALCPPVGAAERATFVIDREGKVAYAIHNEIPNARDHSEVEKHIA